MNQKIHWLGSIIHGCRQEEEGGASVHTIPNLPLALTNIFKMMRKIRPYAIVSLFKHFYSFLLIPFP